MDSLAGEYSSVFVAASLVALYIFLWISVGSLPRLGRWLARLAMALLILAPLALYLEFGSGGSHTKSANKSAAPPATTGGEAKPAQPSAGATPPAKPEKTAEAPKPVPPPPAAAPEPSPAAQPPSVPGALANDDAAKALPAPTEETGGGAGRSRGLGVPAEPEAPATRGLNLDEDETAEPAPPAPQPTPVPADTAKRDWEVVPVFYGTDRSETSTDGKLVYTSDRGRRLELGRALVTIPRAHEIPGIERPWSIRIPYLNVVVGESEDPNKHFTLKELKSLTEAEFLALVRERLAAAVTYKDHAFVFIHGFNTSFDYAVFRAAQITHDLKFDGVPFAYSWPSRGGVSSYTYDRESSGQSERFLKDFLQLVIDKSGATSISVIAHSMGNQPTLQVLKDLKAAKPDGVVLSQIILAAPDVDRDSFENIAHEIQGLAKGITLYAAANDHALYVSRSFNGGIPRAGDVPEGVPLVLPGVDTVDVTAASTDSLGLNHSGYAENNALLKDIAALLQTDQRPPKLRVPTLDEVTTDKGMFWRYPAAK